MQLVFFPSVLGCSCVDQNAANIKNRLIGFKEWLIGLYPPAPIKITTSKNSLNEQSDLIGRLFTQSRG